MCAEQSSNMIEEVGSKAFGTEIQFRGLLKVA